MSNFVFLTGTESRSNSPKITIRKGGMIVLNDRAVEKLGENVTHVQIGYNAESNAIGIRPTTADAAGRYRLRSQQKGSSRIINGKRLFAHHGLTAQTSQTFDVEEFSDGILGVVLSTARKPETEGPTPSADTTDTGKVPAAAKARAAKRKTRTAS